LTLLYHRNVTATPPSWSNHPPLWSIRPPLGGWFDPPKWSIRPPFWSSDPPLLFIQTPPFQEKNAEETPWDGSPPSPPTPDPPPGRWGGWYRPPVPGGDPGGGGGGGSIPGGFFGSFPAKRGGSGEKKGVGLDGQPAKQPSSNMFGSTILYIREHSIGVPIHPLYTYHFSLLTLLPIM
jgi:hypothetical protein